MEEIKNCNIGLIAFPIYYPKEYSVVLGELKDKKTHGDANLLYKIHEKLQYFYPFTLTLTKGEITENSTETRFLDNFTNTISMNKKPPYSEVIEYYAPKLYDLTCMVQLFEDQPRRRLSLNDKSLNHNVFILLTPENPEVRGKIIENCLEVLGEGKNGKKGYFYIIEKEPNTDRTKNYLISRGVSTDNINLQIDKDSPITIESSIHTAVALDPDHIYLATSSSSVADIKKALCHLRNCKRLPDTKFKFICD